MNKNPFEKFERYIKSQARRYSSRKYEIEDLEQIGRIAIWQKLEKEPSAPIEHLLASSKYAMLNYINAWKRQKRKPKEGITSLENFFEIGGRDLSDQEPIFKPDLIVFMKNSLREKFGKKYCESIKKLDSPKKIVKKIFRATIEDIEGISADEVPLKVDWKFFKERQLEWLLWVFYNNSPASAIMDIYKDKFVPWNFRRVPDGYWKGKIGERRTKKAVGWFCKKKNLKSEKDCKKITCKDFQREGLGWMLQYKFRNSPYLALKSIFQNLNPEGKSYIKIENCFDTHEKRKSAVIEYLIELGIGDISGMTPEEIYSTKFREKIGTSEFRKEFPNLLKQYNGDIYFLFKDLFPNQIRPWFLKGNKHVWDGNPKKTASDAIKWLFEKYLKVSIQEIPSYATQEFFKEVGFGGILSNKKLNFNCSPYLAVNNAYPELFSKEDFDRHRKTNNYNLKTILKEKKL